MVILFENRTVIMAIPSTSANAATTTATFPAAAVEAALRTAITQLEQDTAGMREPWEPNFDSLAVVNVIIVVERLLPGFTLEPEKVVRRGGYRTVDEAARDITERIRRRWERRHH
jgi:hypothetical protein